MKVALVQMPVWWTIDPPLGLAQMAGCLKAAGHEVRVFDLNIRLWDRRRPPHEEGWLWEQFHLWNFPDHVDAFFRDNARFLDDQLDALLKTDCGAVGFSVSMGSQVATLRMAERIKAADPSRRIVLGGQFFFLGSAARDALAHPAVDAVIRGAGDEAFPAALADCERAGRFVRRPGLVFRDGDRLVDGGPAEMPRNLDRVPFADFTGFPMELYTDQGRIPMAASRGCVWACRFCSTREFWNGYSYMSGDRIFAEVTHHRRLFPSRTHVDFYDITANGRPETLERFSRLVRDYNGAAPGRVGIGWKINAILRPEMTPDLLGSLHESGCREIIYGVESGSPRVLKLMNKNYDVSVAERVLAATHAAGITTTGNFMFGFPGETEEDFRLTLDFLRRNAGSFDRTYASATFTSLEENSYLTRHPEEFGVREGGREAHHLYWETSDGANTYPVRMDRYRRFRRLAEELGIDAYKGVNGDLEAEMARRLEEFRRFRGEESAVRSGAGA